MRVYIFTSGRSTHDECLTKGVFGIDKKPQNEWALAVSEKDYCVLWNRDTRHLSGLWQATGETGERKFNVKWGNSFPYQAKVNCISADIKSLPLEDVREYIMVKGQMQNFVEGEKAEALLRLFEIKAASPVQSPSKSQSIYQPPFFDDMLKPGRWEKFEDYVHDLMLLLGIHDLHLIPRDKQAGRSDGFFKFHRLAVIYDATLNEDLEDFKAQQMENYVSQLKRERIELPDKKTASFPNYKKRAWIVTRRKTRRIKEEDGILVCEVSVQDLMKLYEKRLTQRMTAEQLEEEFSKLGYEE